MTRSRLTVLIGCLLAGVAQAGPFEARQVYTLTWTADLPATSHGYGVVLGQRGAPTTAPKDWVEPNIGSSATGSSAAGPATSPATTNPSNTSPFATTPFAVGPFAIGIDTFDPPTTNPFNADGNLYDRPPQEISLHLAGREIANRRTRHSLGTPATQPTTRPALAAMTLVLQFVTGGANVTVRNGDEFVYKNVFVPGLSAIDFDPTFGGDAKISDIHAAWLGEPLSPAEAPTHLVALDRVLIDNGHRVTRQPTTFPADVGNIGRVVATFSLARTPAGLDKWDRYGSVYVIDDAGQRFELLRFMTPYSREWTWQQDVTDLLPLLQGHKTLELNCETYGPGWLATVAFDFYPDARSSGPLSPGALSPSTHSLGSLSSGPLPPNSQIPGTPLADSASPDAALPDPPPPARPTPRPFRVTNVWDTTVILGQADRPIDRQLPPMPLSIDPSATRVVLRTLVSGHGWAGNAGNAGEFLPLWRKVHVGDRTFFNNLWTTDNDLNPCRPQGGTWKYDRAGWGPGRLVDPWTIDLTAAVRNPTTSPATNGPAATHSAGRPTSMLSYEIQPYANPSPNKDFPAQHRVSAQLIEYR
ncbi:MAG: putative N-glycosidase [Phycisphaerales bacterium]|nr:putative N-glycosidase [Phycisphaerales bacterium]